jgi:hypothetical protein
MGTYSWLRYLTQGASTIDFRNLSGLLSIKSILWKPHSGSLATHLGSVYGFWPTQARGDTRLVDKVVPPLQSVKLIYQPCSRLWADWTPHMIIELEDENKAWSFLVQVVLSLCWWYIYADDIYIYIYIYICWWIWFMLNWVWYILIPSNQVLIIKCWPTKMLTALNFSLTLLPYIFTPLAEPRPKMNSPLLKFWSEVCRWRYDVVLHGC